MYYTIYKITNRTNGKIYIGCHKTKNLNDHYMGSGVLISRAIEKHGIENFTKEYVHFLKNSAEMYEKEKEVVNESFLLREDVYNLSLGGHGDGWERINNNELTRKEKNKKAAIAMNEANWSNPEWVARKKQSCSESFKRLHKEGKLKPFDWTGRKHKEATKKKIGAANAVHQRGKGNSQYGKVWIYNLKEKRSMKIDKNELDSFLNKGWKKGRKMKFK
jgi:hypothetical protein